jgi:hypothetical protein
LPCAAVWDSEIFSLLQKLGVSADLIGHSVSEYAKGKGAKKFTMIGLNGEKLSLTNRTLLGLARALLSSVDLLLMSNVLDLLGPVQATKAMAVLRELTSRRCLSVLATEAATVPMHLRKKKTVIFSTKLAEIEVKADHWMYLSDDVREDAAAAEGPPVESTAVSTF